MRKVLRSGDVKTRFISISFGYYHLRYKCRSYLWCMCVCKLFVTLISLCPKKLQWVTLDTTSCNILKIFTGVNRNQFHFLWKVIENVHLMRSNISWDKVKIPCWRFFFWEGEGSFSQITRERWELHEKLSWPSLLSIRVNNTKNKRNFGCLEIIELNLRNKKWLRSGLRNSLYGLCYRPYI